MKPEKTTRQQADESSIEGRFKELNLPFNDREALLESNRCLYCYDAPCIVACPTHIDIPTFIRKISSGNVKGSAKTILESNLLGATCSRVCPVQELCEGACVLNEDHKPINIGRLQRHAMDFADKNKLNFFQRGNPNGLRVAIVGAGPAGLSCAGELAKLGFEVICFEKRPLSGGLDTYGIVVFREPVEISLKEVQMIEELGVDMRNGVEIGKDLLLSDLVEDYDAVLISIGLGKVPNLSIAGEDKEGVFDGLEFIEQTKVKDLKTIKCGSKVVVIGGGNTAIDCATIARRLGAPDVTIVYRRSQFEMPAYEFECEFALKEGVRIQFLTNPVEVEGKDKVEKLKCARVELGPPDLSGRRTPRVIADSLFDIPCDMVIKAIGQEKPYDLLSELKKFGVQEQNGYIVVDPKTNGTSNPKIFAAGDCIRHKGEALTVVAVQDGKIAAASIAKMLLPSKTNGKKTQPPGTR